MSKTLIILIVLYIVGCILVPIREYKHTNSVLCAGGCFLACVMGTPLFGLLLTEK
jgi:hypothetical protein